MNVLVIASDHRGVNLKKNLVDCWKYKAKTIIDIGTDDNKVPVDYPDIVHTFSKKMTDIQNSLVPANSTKIDPVGVLICGSGIGVSIAANRYKHLYSFVCHHEDEAFLARSHNNANVLCLGADYVNAEDANKWIDVFYKTPFLEGRHEKRVKKINKNCFL